MKTREFMGEKQATINLREDRKSITAIAQILVIASTIVNPEKGDKNIVFAVEWKH